MLCTGSYKRRRSLTVPVVDEITRHGNVDGGFHLVPWRAYVGIGYGINIVARKQYWEQELETAGKESANLEKRFASDRNEEDEQHGKKKASRGGRTGEHPDLDVGARQLGDALRGQALPFAFILLGGLGCFGAFLFWGSFVGRISRYGPRRLFPEHKPVKVPWALLSK